MGDGKQVTFYMKNASKWQEFKKIAEREGKKASQLLQKYIENYVSLHAPGNPQTLIPSFGVGGKTTIADIEGRIRQLCLERGKTITYRDILDIEKGEGISDGSMRMAMADRIRDWLKEQGRKVFY